jgi:chromosome segregation ATPase
MENPLILFVAVVIGGIIGWFACRARAERHFEARQAALRAQADGLKRELDERVLRIKQLEAQQSGLERSSEADQRRIAGLELEIGRLRMRIVDLESRPTKNTGSG